MKTISVQAKEWFDKVNGNSYFSALITVDAGLATERLLKLPFQYGYDNHYLDVTLTALKDAGLAPESEESIVLWRFCKENNIELFYNKEKNCLQRDVKAFAA